MQTTKEKELPMTDHEIYQQLERLAQLYQWEEIALWTKRAPEGVYEFTAILEGNREFGTEWLCESGRTPTEAADRVIARGGDRDPETHRQKKIRELEMQLAKLKSSQPLISPYRAPNQLGYGVPRDQAPPPASEVTITVDSEKVITPEDQL